MISVIFLIMFLLVAVYVLLCSEFIDEMGWVTRNYGLLLKYIFFKEDDSLTDEAKGLLVGIRVVFVLGLSSYLLILLLIIFPQ